MEVERDVISIQSKQVQKFTRTTVEPLCGCCCRSTILCRMGLLASTSRCV